MSENHEWTAKTRVLIVYLQLKLNEMQNGYLIEILVFLTDVELIKEKKDKKKTPAKEVWIKLFIFREQLLKRRMKAVNCWKKNIAYF